MRYAGNKLLFQEGHAFFLGSWIGNESMGFVSLDVSIASSEKIAQNTLDLEKISSTVFNFKAQITVQNA